MKTHNDMLVCLNVVKALSELAEQSFLNMIEIFFDSVDCGEKINELTEQIAEHFRDIISAEHEIIKSIEEYYKETS